MNKTKLLGQTFTEFAEIKKMLDLFEGEIHEIKIMEPSFGDGQFLLEIIRRIVPKMRRQGINDAEIAEKLNDNIYGFELDKNFFEHAHRNIDELLKFLNLPPIEFSNLKNSTALQELNEKFDLIIGNPPYVRVQNFDQGAKEINKSSSRISGNTDLFLLFIDHYLNYLNENGEFVFIVPNSLGKSKAGLNIRKWMIENGSVKYIDFEDRQLFPKVSVYSCIFHFKLNDKRNSVFISDKDNKEYQLDMNSNYWMPKALNPIKEELEVKNGIATLADSVFIFSKGNEPEVERNFLIDIYKGSRQREKFVTVFPYKIINNKIIRFKSEQEIKKEAPNLYSYLIKNKERLLSRSLEKNSKWFEFGRSQAIQDLTKEKFVINTLIKPGQESLEFLRLKRYTLVFSGLYSIKESFIKYNNNKLIESLRFKAKDMRGGYKKISSSLLKNEK